MINKINKGEKFVCVKNVVMGDTTRLMYEAGQVYQSEEDNCITNREGEIGHRWPRLHVAEQHFIPYTYAAVSAHYDTCKTMDEADPFAMLLLDLEPTLERISARSEACSCGEHNPNGIYGGTAPVKEGFVTPEQMKEVDKKINWRDEKPSYTERYKKITESNSFKQAYDNMSVNSGNMGLPPYYDNTNGSLYKIAEQRGWGVRLFDLVKRLERNGKKDPLEQEIRKSIGVLELWMKEIGA